jgi:hypothetical protein
MAEEKVIKSGVLTIPRLLFLVAIGLLISLTVWRGGIWLTIGYWLMTLGLSGLLFLIVIDYGVKKEALKLEAGSDQAGSSDTQTTASEVVAASASAARVRRRASRPTKRRR